MPNRQQQDGPAQRTIEGPLYQADPAHAVHERYARFV
jgi:hypothetical protein